VTEKRERVGGEGGRGRRQKKKKERKQARGKEKEFEEGYIKARILIH
jgi:hypothetical protein